MTVLDTTSKFLTLELLANVTTNEAQWATHFGTRDGNSFIENSNIGLTSGTTPVVIVSQPTGTQQKPIRSISIYNDDTAPIDFLVKLSDGVTPVVIYSGTVLPNDTWISNLPVTNVSGGSGSGGHTIQKDGVSLTQRANLNFIGNLLNAADNSGNDSTDLTFVQTGTTDGTIPLIGTGDKLDTALIDTGTGANQIVQLDSSGQLPSGIGAGGGGGIPASNHPSNETIFVNATTGNDTNDGLSSGTAVQTIARAMEIASSLKIEDTVTINCTGSFIDPVFDFSGVYADNLVQNDDLTWYQQEVTTKIVISGGTFTYTGTKEVIYYNASSRYTIEYSGNTFNLTEPLILSNSPNLLFFQSVNFNLASAGGLCVIYMNDVKVRMDFCTVDGAGGATSMCIVADKSRIYHSACTYQNANTPFRLSNSLVINNYALPTYSTSGSFIAELEHDSFFYNTSFYDSIAPADFLVGDGTSIIQDQTTKYFLPNPSDPVALPTHPLDEIVYLSITGGNDANDGLSTGNAVSTIERAIEIIASAKINGSITLELLLGGGGGGLTDPLLDFSDIESVTSGGSGFTPYSTNAGKIIIKPDAGTSAWTWANNAPFIIPPKDPGIGVRFENIIFNCQQSLPLINIPNRVEFNSITFVASGVGGAAPVIVQGSTDVLFNACTFNGNSQASAQGLTTLKGAKVELTGANDFQNNVTNIFSDTFSTINASGTPTFSAGTATSDIIAQNGAKINLSSAFFGALLQTVTVDSGAEIHVTGQEVIRELALEDTIPDTNPGVSTTTDNSNTINSILATLRKHGFVV